MPLNKVQEVATLKSFQQLLETNETVAVSFYATWSNLAVECRVGFEQVASTVAKAVFVTIDIGSIDEIPALYEIVSVPTVLVFKNGKIVIRLIGPVECNTLKEMLSQI